MQLEILTPERKVYSGEIFGLQLPGLDGSFEVLENHAPILAALSKGKLKVMKEKNNFSYYNIQEGFIEVLENSITVLVEGAIAAH